MLYLHTTGKWLFAIERVKCKVKGKVYKYIALLVENIIIVFVNCKSFMFYVINVTTFGYFSSNMIHYYGMLAFRFSFLGILLYKLREYYIDLFFNFVSVEHRSVSSVYTVASLDSTRSEKTNQSKFVFSRRLHCRNAFCDYNPNNR